MSTTRTAIQTYVILSGQTFNSVEPYEALRDRLEAAREAMGFESTPEAFSANPMGAPMIQTRAIVHIDDEPVVVDACFNPMHVVLMYSTSGDPVI